MMIQTIQPAAADDCLELHANNLASILRSYLPVFNEAIGNAKTAAPAAYTELLQQHTDASNFLQAWKNHAEGQPVTTDEFNGLRKIRSQIDTAIHQYGPVSRGTKQLSMAAFAVIGK